MACAVAVASVQVTAAAPRARPGEDAEDAFGELDGRLTLRFTDALNGKPVAGATVRFRGAEGVTDGSGAVQFAMPEGLGADERMMEATFEKPGYVTTAVRLRFMAGTLFANRFSVSPSLPPGRLRIVLDWEATPPDLDAHLIKQGGWHISFRDMQKFEDLAFLDRDDMDGLGPETITVARVDNRATYHFVVHDYTHRGSTSSEGIAKGRARVRLYTERGLWDAFDAPLTLKGDRWEVFSIVQGQVVKPAARR
jgi:hypothetical protein